MKRLIVLSLLVLTIIVSVVAWGGYTCPVDNCSLYYSSMDFDEYGRAWDKYKCSCCGRYFWFKK